VNALGSVINEATGLPWEVDLELNQEFGPLGRRPVKLPENTMPQSSSNTTIGVVATDAILTKPQAQKVAQMAQDGLARAIRPAHTMFDGDTIFCVSTGKRDLPQAEGFFVVKGAEAINEIGRAAADCTSRAIIRAVLEARSLGTMIAHRDLTPL
jgi:L-aminopeptidase/D-esterase-like protein